MVNECRLLKLLINAALHAHPHYVNEDRESIRVIIAQVQTQDDKWIIIGLQRYFPAMNFWGSLKELETQLLEIVDFKRYQLHADSVEVEFAVCVQPEFIVHNPFAESGAGWNRFYVDGAKVTLSFKTLGFSADFAEVNTLLLSITSILGHPEMPFLSHVNEMSFYPTISGLDQEKSHISAGIHLKGEKKEWLRSLLDYLLTKHFQLTQTENHLGSKMEFNVRYMDEDILVKIPASSGHRALHKIPRIVLAKLSNPHAMQEIQNELVAGSAIVYTQ